MTQTLLCVIDPISDKPLGSAGGAQETMSWLELGEVMTGGATPSGTP